MVFLDSKDGIICDLCNQVLQKRFSYYSIEYAKVDVDCEKKMNRTDVDAKVLNLDICPTCYEKQCEVVKKLIQKREKEGTWTCKAPNST